MVDPKNPVVPSSATPTIAVPKGCERREVWIEHLIKSHDWRLGVELGVWKGRTFLHLLHSCPDLTLIGIDLWEPQPTNEGPQNFLDWPHHENERMVREAGKPFGERARLVKDWTVEAAKSIDDESLDFIFIDADHSSEAVRGDLLAWMPKVKPEGWLLGHDINWPSVQTVVDELVPGYIVGPDNTWARPKIHAYEAIQRYLGQDRGAVRLAPRPRSFRARVNRLLAKLR